MVDGDEGADRGGDGERSVLEALPFVRRGLSSEAPGALRTLMEVLWRFLFDFQNHFEDVRGVDGRPAYLVSLKFEIAALLYEVDEMLSCRTASDPLHHLALAFELGAPSLCGLFGQDVLDTFFGVDVRGEVGEEVERVCAFGARLRASMPGKIHDLGDTGGASYALRILRRWSAIAQARNEDLSFAATLLKRL